MTALTYECGYCNGAAERNENGQLVHATTEQRVTPNGPGDLVSDRHNQAGTPIGAHDLVEREACTAGFVTGEFGTDCDLDANHPMPHEGQDPMDDRPGKRVQWEGGGFCAGDPLPYRNVRYIG